MLRVRVLSALVGIPIVLAAVYFGEIWYALFLLLVANLGMREYTLLLRSAGYRFPALPGHLGASAIIALIYLDRVDLFFPLLMLIFSVTFLLVLIYFKNIQFWESAAIFWGIIYLGGFCGFMLLLRMLPEGLIYTLFLLFGVWLNDSFAYFIGIKWGKRKLAPGISPNKSVAGAIGGIVGNVIVAVLVAHFAPAWLPLPLAKAAALALGIAVFAQAGDLMESAMKRQFKVKDTGRLIPGHGGVLDRFDSLFFTAPFVYYFFVLAG